MSVEERNKRALERLRLTDEFVRTEQSLEALLDEFRLHLSKTKSIVGFSHVSAGVIDNRELEEAVRIEFDEVGKNFVLHESEESGKRAYAPFGLLEPLTAKKARGCMQNALLVVCQLASLQKKLRDLHN